MTFRKFALRSLFLLVVVTLVLALWRFRTTFMLAFLAVVLAVLISIPMSYLERVMPRAVAVMLSVLATVVITFGLGVWLIPTIGVDLYELVQRIPALATQLSQTYTGLSNQETVLGRVLPPLTGNSNISSLTPERLRQFLGDALSTGLPVLVSGGSFIFTLLANLFLVVMLAIFFIAEPKAYVRASLYLVPKHRQAQLRGIWSVLYHTLRTWLSTLLISISITATLVVLILGALGMPNVMVVAVFAGLATFIPNIGAILPMIPIVVFLLVGNPAQIPLMVGAYLSIQLLESNVLTPSVVRRQLSIPPAATLLTQILGGYIFGVLGVLLAVPLLAVMIALVRELYSYNLLHLRGATVSVALPDPTPHAKDTRFSQRVRALRQSRKNRRVVAVPEGEGEEPD